VSADEQWDENVCGEYPEHNYPPGDNTVTCRRCDAEVEADTGEEYVPGFSCAEGVPCPPFEDVTLEVSPDAPEPGAFARAAFGDEWTERTARGYAERHVGDVTKSWFGEKHGWLTYEEAVGRGLGVAPGHGM
jgi:hypothetical protein